MGDLGLVWESQHERRALMTQVAPRLVRRMPMVLAAYRGGPKGPAVAGAGDDRADAEAATEALDGALLHRAILARPRSVRMRGR